VGKIGGLAGFINRVYIFDIGKVFKLPAIQKAE